MKRAIAKSFFTLFIVALVSDQATAQDLPKIVPPSPTTSALFRFQDYPMDYSTGLPEISIPIYVVKSGSLTVPVSISYHASGRKVYDRDGPIGVGWSLNAGGSVTRTIYGAADFGTFGPGEYKFPYPFVTGNLTNYNDLEYLMRIAHVQKSDCNIYPFMDSEYDIFSYSFGQNSGKFFFKDNNGVKTVAMLPYKPISITPYFTSSATPIYTRTGLSSFDIVDENGILYQFGAIETYSTLNNNAGSSWMLTKIVSADKTDEITFIYSGTTEVRRTISQTSVLEDSWVFSATGPPAPQPDLNDYETTSEDEYQPVRLSEIRFKDGKVVFNMVSGAVNSIQIFNLGNEVLKTIQLNRSQCYSQSELGYAINKLDGIVFKDKNSVAVENYTFEYYPLVSSNGELNVRYRDWWGYYNNSQVHDMVPGHSVPHEGGGGLGTIYVGNVNANRNPSLEPKKSGVLKKITFPTGGSTEFVYENNMCTLYGAVANPVEGPGLRIQQIKTIERPGSLPILKTYKYGVNESGYGSIELLPELIYMAKEIHVRFLAGNAQNGFDPSYSGGYRQRTFYSDFLPELSPIADRPVIYTEVAEYHGTPTNNVGKTVYKYDYSPWAVSGMPPGASALAFFTQRRHIYNYNYWNNPSLVLKQEYKKVNSGSSPYQLARESFSTYTTTVIENVKGLHLEEFTRMPQTGLGTTTPPGGTTTVTGCAEKCLAWNTSGQDLYMFNEYQIPVGYKTLVSNAEIVYNDVGAPQATGSSYTYNSKQLPSLITHTPSDGISISTQIKYPFDYTGNATLDQMVSLNMLNFPVERIETKNTSPSATHVKSVKTNYFNWGTTNPMIAPQSVEVKNGANSYETRLRFHAYDAEGNVSVVSKENDVKIIYIWGYNNYYPVAEVKGISYATAMSVLNQSVIQNPASDQALRDELNKIRQSYPAAMVSSFTYKPLVGLTSQTDASGKTVFFEYDDYSRLKLVRDLNGNIIKTYKYQVQGAAAN